MKLIDALANLDADARLSDGRRIWEAADLVSQIAGDDEDEYDTGYLRDGRYVIYRVDASGNRQRKPAFIEVRETVRD